MKWTADKYGRGYGGGYTGRLIHIQQKCVDRREDGDNKRYSGWIGCRRIRTEADMRNDKDGVSREVVGQYQ